MSAEKTLSEYKKNQAKTRLLLALFEADKPVNKKILNGRVVPKKEKVRNYQSVFDELVAVGAIEKSKQGYFLSSPKGLELLDESLRIGDLEFDGTIIGTWIANSLLKKFREIGSNDYNHSNAKTELIDNKKIIYQSEKSSDNQQSIDSYNEFESKILNLFEKLDKGYNYSGLVPIWHLRNELSNQVSPEKFNDWLMEMQASQLLYLQSGEARGASEEQKRDSIYSEIRGLLFFASKLS